MHSIGIVAVLLLLGFNVNSIKISSPFNVTTTGRFQINIFEYWMLIANAHLTLYSTTRQINPTSRMATVCAACATISSARSAIWPKCAWTLDRAIAICWVSATNTGPKLANCWPRPPMATANWVSVFCRSACGIWSNVAAFVQLSWNAARTLTVRRERWLPIWQAKWPWVELYFCVWDNLTHLMPLIRRTAMLTERSIVSTMRPPISTDPIVAMSIVCKDDARIGSMHVCVWAKSARPNGSNANGGWLAMRRVERIPRNRRMWCPNRMQLYSG